MVGMDSGTPPVLFVVGTAGAGKSSLVTSFQRWSRFLEIDTIAVNLDPGAERVHYDAEFDVRDLISLTEVMTEYDLGPNGAQILAADLLAAQGSDVAADAGPDEEGAATLRGHRGHHPRRPTGAGDADEHHAGAG